MDPLSVAMGSVKGVYEIAKGILSLSEDVAVKQKASELINNIIELQNGMLGLQSQLSSLSTENRELKNQLMNIENWEKEKTKFEVFPLKSKSAVMVPKLGTESPYKKLWYCANCFEERKLSVLQRAATMREAPLKCPRCGAIVNFAIGEWNLT